MTLSWQPSHPIYHPLDIEGALCCFFYPANYSIIPLHTIPEPAAFERRQESSAKKKKKQLRKAFFLLGKFAPRPLEKSLSEGLGRREGGDTGASAAPCNYGGSRCIVPIFDGLRHRWIRPQRRREPRASSRKSRAGEGWRGRKEGGSCECLTADVTENRLFRKDGTARSLRV